MIQYVLMGALWFLSSLYQETTTVLENMLKKEIFPQLQKHSTACYRKFLGNCLTHTICVLSFTILYVELLPPIQETLGVIGPGHMYAQ